LPFCSASAFLFLSSLSRCSEQKRRLKAQKKAEEKAAKIATQTETKPKSQNGEQAKTNDDELDATVSTMLYLLGSLGTNGRLLCYVMRGYCLGIEVWFFSISHPEAEVRTALPSHNFTLLSCSPIIFNMMRSPLTT